MTIPITAHASSNHLTDNANKATNQCSTQANDEDNGGIPETSLRRHNTKEVTTPGPTISSPIESSLEGAKASHLANDSRHRVPSKEIALYVARLATVLLIVHSVATSKLCFFSHNNPPRLKHSVKKLSAGQLTTGCSISVNSFGMLGNDVPLLPVSNVGVVELHAVKLGLTKDGTPCHQQKNLKPSAKLITTTTQCKTLVKARVTYILDENGPRLLLFVV